MLPLILQFALFLAYVGYIYKRFGVLTSISASTYSLKGNKRYLFLAWLWLTGFLTFFHSLNGWQFLSGAGFIFTGITIEHAKSSSLEDEVHLVGTILAILGIFIGLGTLNIYWPSIIMSAGSAYLWFHEVKNRIWWIECLGYATGVSGLISVVA